MVIAGVLIETVPGAEPRVAARLLRVQGLTLEGGDGDHRIAATIEADRAEAVEELTRRLLDADAEILGVYPTFVGAAPDLR
jgi:hypothetical protein